MNRRRDSRANGAGCYEFRTKFFLLYQRREDGVSCWDGFVWAQGRRLSSAIPFLSSYLLIFDP